MSFSPVSPVVRSILGVIFISALLALYLAATLNIGIVLVGTGDPVAVIMGIALFILPVVGAWALVRELMFGVQSAKLTRRLADEGGLPVDDLPHRPSGRAVREAADREFPAYAAAVEAAPTSWQARFRLGLAYDACGDRRRARASIREAIALSKTAS
jgi:hypothetical protein